MSSDQQKRSESEEPTIAPEEQSAEAPTIPPSDEQKPSASPLPGTKVRYFGDYELLEEIARGGMGVVYKARQISLNRIVAMKMILAGQLAGQAEVERFHVEAEAAAKLDHPGIVPIFEVGEHEGQHYFSMGYVDGHSLADKLNDGPLPTSEAAKLTRHLAEAVAYAHEQGVVHRDLKPANVLLDKNDQPRITDFGLAKKMEADSNLTGTGQVLGTPSYMPPEQAAGKTQDVGPTADVYSLGAVLYAMLTGRPPFQAASPMDTLLQVLEQEPVAPRRLDTKVPQDVETISLKCLEKESSRRYASARELVDELERFLNGQPIHARPLNAPTRLWRWCRRKPALAALTAILILALVVGFVGITTQWIRAEKEWLRAETNARQKTQLAEQKTALAHQKTELAQKERDARQAAERLMRISQAQGLAAQAENARKDSPLRSLLLSIEAVQSTRRNNEPALPIALRALKTGLATVGGRPLTAHKGRNWVVMSHDGRRLAAAGEDGILQVWDLTASDPLASRLVLPAGEAGVGQWPVISHDGRWLVASSEGSPGQLWDLTASDPVASRRVLWQEEGTAWFARRFSPNNRWLVASAHLPAPGAAGLCVWDLDADDPAAGAKVLLPPSPRLPCLVYSLSISADSRLLAAAGPGGTRLWDLTAQDVAASAAVFGGQLLYAEGNYGAAISPDGHWLFTPGGDNDAPPLSDLRVKDATLETLQRQIRDAVPQAGARLWDLTAKNPTASPFVLRTDGPVDSMAISPNGRWLVAGGPKFLGGPGLAFSGSWFQIWDLTASDPSANQIALPSQEIAMRLAISQNSRWLVTASDGPGDTIARLWDLTANDPASTATQLEHEGAVVSLALSADSRWLATGSRDKTIRLWDLNADHPAASSRVLRGHDHPLMYMSMSPNGRWLVTGDLTMQALSVGESRPRFDLTWRLWDLHPDSDSSTALVLPLKTANAYSSKIVVSADSRWLATAGYVQKNGANEPEFLVRLWDLDADNPAANWLTFEGADPIAITPNGRWLLTSGSSMENRKFARLWDLTAPDSSKSPIVLSRHKRMIEAVLVSSDGHWLLSRDESAAWLWDLTAEDPASTAVELRGYPHSKSVFENGMAFSSDGRWLAIVGAVTLPLEDSNLITLDKTAWLWDLGRKGPDSQPVALRGHEKPILTLAFSPDDRWLITGSEDETARLWDLRASKPGDTSLVLDGLQVEDRRELIRLPFAVSPNNRYLITTGPSARIWDLTVEDPAGSVREITTSVDNHIAISPNGRWLADRERLWDLRAKHLTKPVLLRGNPSGTQLAISPDSRWLLGTNRDGPAQLWDLAADRPASVAIPFEDETAGIVSAQFSPDGTWLITASKDGAFRLWDMRLETWIEAARQLAGRELTPEERREYLLDQIPGASNATDRR